MVIILTKNTIMMALKVNQATHTHTHTDCLADCVVTKTPDLAHGNPRTQNWFLVMQETEPKSRQVLQVLWKGKDGRGDVGKRDNPKE